MAARAAQPEIAPNENVFAIGNPVGFGWSLTRGTVSALRRQPVGNREVPLIQTDATLNPGNSGGGLYNDNGELVGIADWIINPELARNMGFAIRLTVYDEVAPEEYAWRVQ